MRWMLAGLLVCAAVNAKAADTKAEPGERAQVTAFLKKHVLGKTLSSPKKTYKRDEGRMEGDYEEQSTFNNFTETAQGFTFDFTVVSKELRFELDRDGKRVGPGRDLSGVEVYRYEIVERVSSRKLIGTARLLSMTTRVPSRDGAMLLVTRIGVKASKLSWDETLPGYLDLVTVRGKYKPGSWDSRTTFSITEGKLQMAYDVTVFDVDPETLKRTPTKEKVPTAVATEAEEKPDR